MRWFLFLLLLITGTINLKAATLDGYILTKNNDTVKCKIKTYRTEIFKKVTMLELFDKVTIEDSSGNSITYKANKQEINGFGLVLDDQKYDYVLKVNEDNEWKFLIRKVQGGRFSVYYSFYFANGYGGGASYRTDIFMIEDSSQKTVTVEGGIFSSYKKKIRRFLNNDKNLIDLFDKRVLNITDIPRFIKEANAVK